MKLNVMVKIKRLIIYLMLPHISKDYIQKNKIYKENG